MKKENKPDSELFFWIKEGQEDKGSSIHSIRNDSPKIEPARTLTVRRKEQIDSARAGLKPGWTRASFIVREDNLKKIKALAYWERKNIKQILDEALAAYFKDKDVKPIPESFEG